MPNQRACCWPFSDAQSARSTPCETALDAVQRTARLASIETFATLARMSFEHEGGCQCGMLRYRIHAKPVAVALCHCTFCQRQTGSAFSMAMLVPEHAFTLLQGELKTWTRSSDSGRPVVAAFCPECGTRITSRSEVYKGYLNVRPGTLDDRSWLRPTDSYWTREKQPWLAVPEGLKVHDTQPVRV